MKKILPLVLALLSAQALALGSDRNEPLKITAQSLEADAVGQSAVYIGKVSAAQGTMRITGERLEIRETPQGYKEILVTGQNAAFQEQSGVKDGAAVYSHGAAQAISYSEKDALVTLEGRAKAWKTRGSAVSDSVSGAKILYDVRTGNARLAGGGSPGVIIIRR